MAGRGRRRSEYRILKDREHEEQRQYRSQIIQEGFQMLEEIDEAVTWKIALLEKMQDAFALEPGEQREGESLVRALWRREIRERWGFDEKSVMLAELEIIGRDIRGLASPEGGLRPLADLDDMLARNVVEVNCRELKDGRKVWSYKLESRGKALERLEKMLGMYDRVEEEQAVEESFDERLARARKRAGLVV